MQSHEGGGEQGNQERPERPEPAQQGFAEKAETRHEECPREAAGGSVWHVLVLIGHWSPRLAGRFTASEPFGNGIAVYHFVQGRALADNCELIAMNKNFGDQGA